MGIRFSGHTISPRSRLKMAEKIHAIWEKEPELTITEMTRRTGYPRNVIQRVRQRRVDLGKMQPNKYYMHTGDVVP